MINISSLSPPPSVSESVVTQSNANGESSNNYKKVVIDNATNTLKFKTSSYSFGELSFQANVTTIVPSGIGTPMLIALNSTLHNNVNFDSSANCRLRYIGTVNSVPMIINANLSALCATNGRISSVFIAINGSVQTRTQQASTVSSNVTSNTMAQMIAVLNPNDYIEVFISNDSTTDALTVRHFSLIVRSLPT